MATADEYASWIVKNQDKKGTPEFETVAQAYRLAKQEIGDEATQEDKDYGKKYGGLLARSAIKGVAAPAALVADAFGGVANKAQDVVLGQGRGYRFMQQLPQLDKLLTELGLAQPEGAGERIASEMAESMVGAAGAAKLASKASKPIADLFANNVRGQITSAALGTGAAGIARESGQNEYVQAGAGLAGALSPVAGQAITRPTSVIAKRLIEPWTEKGLKQLKGRTANIAAGDPTGTVISALDSPDVFVAGVNPTAGEAAAKAGSVGFSGLQDVLKRRFVKAANRFSEIDDANEAARRAAVQSVGKDKPTLDAAIAKRSADAAAEYGAAYQQVVSADPALARIASSPYFKAAMPDAATLASHEGITFKSNPTRYLHLVKISLDKMLSKQGDSALAETEKRAVEQVKNGLVTWIGNKNKAYDTARQMFGSRSVPINQMQVGQFLENKLTAPLTGAERPAAFAQAMRDASGTIRKAGTGAPRYDDLSKIMSPGQMDVLTGVQKDLARTAQYEQQARLGSEAVRNTLKMEMAPIEPSNILHRGVTIARDILERIQGRATTKTLESLAMDMQDPAVMAMLMKNATPQEKIELLKHMKSRSVAGLLGFGQTLPTIGEQ